MVGGNDLDSVKDSSPETLFAQHVKLVKIVNTCYKIKDKKNISTESTLTQISTESSWRLLPPAKKNMFFYAFTCEDIDFVENMNFPYQFFFCGRFLIL